MLSDVYTKLVNVKRKSVIICLETSFYYQHPQKILGVVNAYSFILFEPQITDLFSGLDVAAVSPVLFLKTNCLLLQDLL